MSDTFSENLLPQDLSNLSENELRIMMNAWTRESFLLRERVLRCEQCMIKIHNEIEGRNYEF